MTHDLSKPSHEGACHCGRVRFAFEGRIKTVFDCNCTLCRRKGALWHGVPDQGLRITGQDQLALYQYATMTSKHYFCTHCGIAPFARSRLDPANWVVNVRCIDAVDLAALTVLPFDGLHWDEGVKAFLAMRQAAAPT